MVQEEPGPEAPEVPPPGRCGAPCSDEKVSTFVDWGRNQLTQRRGKCIIQGDEDAEAAPHRPPDG